jgi:hypothetical protein
MTRPNVMEVKVDTGETIIREMNDEEYAQHLIDVAAEVERNAEEPTND